MRKILAQCKLLFERKLTGARLMTDSIDFVVPDDAVKYTAEDIAKTKALLDMMMKQMKKQKRGST